MKSLSLLFVLALVYAVVRYNVFGDVAPEQIPVYILNKAVSAVSVTYLLCSAVASARARSESARFWARAAVHSAGIHVLLTLAILSLPYYPKFFGEEQFTFAGELSLMFGVLAAYLYLLLQSRRLSAHRAKRLKLAAIACVAGHLAAMGGSGWVTVSTWPGYLPPISLLCFLIVCASFVYFMRGERDH